MASKKSQLALFVIIGLVILALFGLMFSGLSALRPNSQKIQFDRPNINSYITSCLKSTAEDALFLLGKQGGNINPKNYLQSESYKISYLYNNGKNDVPSKESIESQLSDYIDANLLACLDDFNAFRRQGWSVDFEQPKTTTQININDVSFTADFEASFALGDSTISLDQFSHSSDVRLSKILDVADEIIDFHTENPEWTDLTALSRHDLEITIFPYNKRLVYSIEDKKSEIMSNPYMFNFALSFSG